MTESKWKKSSLSSLVYFIVFCESLSNQRVVFKVVQRQRCSQALFSGALLLGTTTASSSGTEMESSSLSTPYQNNSAPLLKCHPVVNYLY